MKVGGRHLARLWLACETGQLVLQAARHAYFHSNDSGGRRPPSTVIAAEAAIHPPAAGLRLDFSLNVTEGARNHYGLAKVT